MWPLFAGAHEWTAPRATAVKRTGVITTGTVSARPSTLALMRAAPGANVTTTPVWDTRARSESLLAQTTGRPVSGRPLESRSVTARRSVSPAMIVAESGVTLTAATAGGGGPGGVGGTNGPSHAHRPMVTTTQRLFIGVPRWDYIPGMRGPALVSLTAMCAVGPLPAQVPDTIREELPRLLAAAPFAYPESLTNAGVRGLVLVRALIDSSGHAMAIGSTVPATSDHRLDSIAVSYIRGLTFKPGRRNGAPTPAAVLIAVEFRPAPLEGRVYESWEVDSALDLVDNPIVPYPRAPE